MPRMRNRNIMFHAQNEMRKENLHIQQDIEYSTEVKEEVKERTEDGKELDSERDEEQGRAAQELGDSGGKEDTGKDDSESREKVRQDGERSAASANSSWSAKRRPRK